MKRQILFGVVLALPLLPAPALAQAGNACWAAVTRDAVGMLGANNITHASQIVEQRSDVEDMVTGTGRADGRPFSYHCTYNHRNRAAYAVQISSDGGDPGRDFGRPAFDNRPPPPPPQRNPRELAAEACYNPVLAYAQRQHPTASNFKIFLSDNRFGQQGPMEIRVNGQGELRQLDRRRERFTYYCTYNARTRRVGDISMTMSR
jgi:hypothetical protein